MDCLLRIFSNLHLYYMPGLVWLVWHKYFWQSMDVTRCILSSLTSFLNLFDKNQYTRLVYTAFWAVDAGIMLDEVMDVMKNVYLVKNRTETVWRKYAYIYTFTLTSYSAVLSFRPHWNIFLHTHGWQASGMCWLCHTQRQPEPYISLNRVECEPWSEDGQIGGLWLLQAVSEEWWEGEECQD